MGRVYNYPSNRLLEKEGRVTVFAKEPRRGGQQTSPDVVANMVKDWPLATGVRLLSHDQCVVVDKSKDSSYLVQGRSKLFQSSGQH
jgi:hypothetical protein